MSERRVAAQEHWEREGGNSREASPDLERGLGSGSKESEGEQERQLQDTFVFNPRAVRNPFVSEGVFWVLVPIPETLLLLLNNGNPMLHHMGAIFSCSNNQKLIELCHWRCAGNWCTSTVNTAGWTRVKGPVSHKHSHKDQYPDLLRHTFWWYLWDKAQVNLDLDNLTTVTNAYNPLSANDKKILGDTRLLARYLQDQKKKYIGAQLVTHGEILTIAPEDCLTNGGKLSSLVIQSLKTNRLLALLLSLQ